MSGRYNAAQKNLTLLQGLIRKDPESYRAEFSEQFRHFQQTLKIYQLQPNEMDCSSLLQLVSFISQLSHLFPKESRNFGPDLMDILRVQSSHLDTEVRLSFCKALILLRNRKVLSGLDLTKLFFDHLMKIHDKVLRKFLYKSIVSHIKLINSTKGKRDPELSTKIQNYIFSRLKDSHSITVRTALMVNIDCFRKQLWQNSKTANAIAECSFNRNTKIKVRSGGDYKIVRFNQATGLVSLLRRQICLNPVWLGGLRSSASLRSPSDRSGSLREPSQPTRQTGFRQIWRRSGETKPVA